MESEQDIQQIKEIRSLVESASGIIRPISTLKSFVCRNPLGGLNNLEFTEAIKQGYYYFQQKHIPKEMEAVNRETIKWSQAFFDNYQATILMPNKDLGFYKAWKKLSIFDDRIHHNNKSIIQNLKSLPDEAEIAIMQCLLSLKIPKESYLKFLILIITTLPGWAGYAKYTSEFTQTPTDSRNFIDYLAVRLVITSSIWNNAFHILSIKNYENSNFNKFLSKIKDNESEYRKNLIHLFKKEFSTGLFMGEKKADAQLVFCVDIRLEPFRRHLEKQGNYETFGYPGFFNLPIGIEDPYSREIVPSCPSTMHPKYIINFSSKSDKTPSFSNINLRDQCQYAENVLRTIGLIKNFSPLVLFCGHEVKTSNNPYAAALNCGACSGRQGRENAKILVSILNNLEVRKELQNHRIEISDQTQFLAAIHDTATNEFEIFYEDNLNKQQIEILNKLKQDLPSPSKIAESRNCNWAETRPEWGLAKNASIIIAPRAISKNIDLESRSFLQSYDWRNDDNGVLLQNILSGGMLVAHSINAQYLFSTFDNIAYGGGDRVTQNITGKFGAMQGNASDLMYGLPSQSVFKNDTDPYHEVLRLTVVIYAPLEFIKFQGNTMLENLLHNDWITFITIDPSDNQIYRLESNLTWSSA